MPQKSRPCGLSLPHPQQSWGKGAQEMLLVLPSFCSELQQLHVWKAAAGAELARGQRELCPACALQSCAGSGLNQHTSRSVGLPGHQQQHPLRALPARQEEFIPNSSVLYLSLSLGGSASPVCASKGFPVPQAAPRRKCLRKLH